MKVPQPVLFLLCLSSGLAAGEVSMPTLPPVSDSAMLSAIAEVESGNNAMKRGHDGERTRLQIMPETWRHFSRMPHSASAFNPAETDRVARAYLGVIRGRLRERGLPETPFFIAAGWNAGAGWTHLRARTVSYAERVANLVEAAQPKSAIARAIAPNSILLPPLPFATRSTLVAAHTASIPMIRIDGAN